MSTGSRRWGVDLERLGDRVIQSFLDHALRDGFFHADMHQGNLKVREDGAIMALDFGIMGRIDPLTRRYYAEILYGFLERDYKPRRRGAFRGGLCAADRDVDLFAQALRSIGEPIFGQDVSKISMARLLAHLFEVTERFGMRTQTQLILLQRTMVVVEGVARSLNPADWPAPIGRGDVVFASPRWPVLAGAESGPGNGCPPRGCLYIPGALRRRA
jgi:ubiquinone biosynthesis protein